MFLAVAGDAPGYAAQRPIDQASFLIMRGGNVVGAEDFEIRPAAGAAGGAYTVTTTAYYPADQPTHLLVAAVQLGADSQITSAQFELQQNGVRQRVLVTVGERRITVRMGTAGHEATREFPGGRRQMLADDSVFALHALLPGSAPGAVQILWPRSGQRTAGTLNPHGQDTTTVGGAQRTLRHVSLETGEATRHLWYDDQGRLVKVSIPALGLTAVRRSTGRP